MGKTKKNIVYNAFYQLLIIAIPLITTPYLSRVLGSENTGMYSYQYAIATYFVLFVMLGLNNYGNRTIAINRDDVDQLSHVFCSIYAMQLFVGLIVVALYVIYAIFLSNNLMTWILLIYVISAVIDINWFYFGLEQFKITVIRNTLIKFVTTFLIFIFVRDGNDLIIYTTISVLGTLIGQIVLWINIPKFIHKTKVGIRDVLIHVKPNLILFVPVVAISLYKYMDKIMLGFLSNMKEVGYFEYSERVIQVPMALINSLGTVMLPKMSNLNAKGKTETINQYILSSATGAIAVSSILCFGIMGVAEQFVPVFLGNGYDTCIVLFKILLPSCVFLAFANVIRTQYLIPQKKDKIYIVSVFCGAIVNMILNAVLISNYGSKGAAVGTLVAEMVVCIFQVMPLRNELDIKRIVFSAIPYFGAGILMYCILCCVQFEKISLLYLLIKIMIGACLYIVLLCIILKVFNRTKYGKDAFFLIDILTNKMKWRN